jgi:hypothetical protein
LCDDVDPLICADDGVRNGDEAGVDCGGACEADLGACPPPEVGAACDYDIVSGDIDGGYYLGCDGLSYGAWNADFIGDGTCNQDAFNCIGFGFDGGDCLETDSVDDVVVYGTGVYDCALECGGDAMYDCTGEVCETESIAIFAGATTCALTMFDTWGDGWQGQTVTVNGMTHILDPVATQVACPSYMDGATCGSDGLIQTQQVVLSLEGCVTVDVTAGTAWANEVSWSLTCGDGFNYYAPAGSPGVFGTFSDADGAGDLFGTCLDEAECCAAGFVDACGVCGGDGSSCAGCDGVDGSGAYNDDCGNCVTADDPSILAVAGDFNDCFDCAGDAYGLATADCAGACEGSAVVEACGNCVAAYGDTVAVDGTDYLECRDCAGVPNGFNEDDIAGGCCLAAALDCAGVCSGDGALDCAGVCDGDAAQTWSVPTTTSCLLTLTDSFGDGWNANAGGNGLTLQGVPYEVLGDGLEATISLDVTGDLGWEITTDRWISEASAALVCENGLGFSWTGGANDASATVHTFSGTMEVPADWFECCDVVDIDGMPMYDDCGVCGGDSSTCCFLDDGVTEGVSDDFDTCCESVSAIDCGGVCNGTNVTDGAGTCCDSGALDCGGVCDGPGTVLDGSMDCTYELTDAFGDGWNGGSITMFDDTVTIASGSSASGTLSGTYGGDVVVAHGAWQTEMTWQIDCGDYGVWTGAGSALSAAVESTTIPMSDLFGTCCAGGFDAAGICGGDCTADVDADGLCDDVDPCLDPGVVADCAGTCGGTAVADCAGVCEGPGQLYTECAYDFTAFGAADCDAAWDAFEADCATLEGTYSWDCGGCACPGDDGGTFDECCAEGFDATGVCGGDCEADGDADGLCDDVDPCLVAGEEPDCAGVCAGPGVMSGGAMCQLTMNDSFGDGWGGGTLTIDGTDYTLATGASDTADVMVFGTPELVAGFSSWPGEVSWSLDCFEFGLAEGTGDPDFGPVSAGTIATPEMACCGTDVYDASGACCEEELDTCGTCDDDSSNNDVTIATFTMGIQDEVDFDARDLDYQVCGDFDGDWSCVGSNEGDGWQRTFTVNVVNGSGDTDRLVNYKYVRGTDGYEGFGGDRSFTVAPCASSVDVLHTYDDGAQGDCFVPEDGSPDNWHGYVDNCGVCDGDVSNDCSSDCDGVPGGSSVLDECGTCDADPGNDCVQDCAGIWGGTGTVDLCGGCTSDADYAGCVEDECGVWGGDGSTCAFGVECGDGETYGCDNVCGSGTSFGLCTLEMTDSFGDGWTGGANVTIDGEPYTTGGFGSTVTVPVASADGIQSVSYFGGNWPSEIGWTLTCGSETYTLADYLDDPTTTGFAGDIACDVYDYDCEGTLDGSAVEDCAGVCGGTTAIDCAGVCGGATTLDCDGACGGVAEFDNCGDCAGGTTGVEACVLLVFGDECTDGDGALTTAGCNTDSTGGAVCGDESSYGNCTLSMVDSFGDGWNGGSVVIDGESYTITGSSGEAVVPATSKFGIDAVLFNTGSWRSEISWTLTCGSETFTDLDYGTTYAVSVDTGFATELTCGAYDCEGTLDGSAVEDCSGVCGGTDIPCDGVCGSGAVIDGCADCVGGTTGAEACASLVPGDTCDSTDDGVDDAIVDCAGDCGGNSTTLYNYGLATSVVEEGSWATERSWYVSGGADVECELVMDDSWGDSWNGATIDINGQTFDGPATDTRTETVSLQGILSVNFTCGSFCGETSWGLTCGDVLSIGGSSGTGSGEYNLNSQGPFSWDDVGDEVGAYGPSVQVALFDSFGDGWNGGIMNAGGTDMTITTGAYTAYEVSTGVLAECAPCEDDPSYSDGVWGCGDYADAGGRGACDFYASDLPHASCPAACGLCVP